MWPADTVAEFLERSDRDGDRLHPSWTLGGATGVRRGEALRLRWADVDLTIEMATTVRTLVTSTMCRRCAAQGQRHDAGR